MGVLIPGRKKTKINKKPRATNRTVPDDTGKDSLFRFQGVDFGYIVAGDEAFSLRRKGFSFPPFSMPGIETHIQKGLFSMTQELQEQLS